MKESNEFPETLKEAIQYFADADNAHNFMVAIRWPDGKVTCPRCQSSDTVYMAERRLYRCRACQKQSSVKIGTIFEESPLGLDKWLPAFWMICNAKNGISSCELARALGVTQKTAWFMLHRIRLALRDGSIGKLSGEIEVDETYVGGISRKMNNRQRRKRATGSGMVGKAVVMGILERKGRVIAKAVPSAKLTTLSEHIYRHVEPGSAVYTDTLPSYHRLHSHYAHETINHAVCYVKDRVHTNGLENFWSLLKRTIRGTYVSVEPFHLFRYLDEQAFRFNERKNTDAGRFLIGIMGVIGRRLKYAKLISEAGSHEETATGTREAKTVKRHMKRRPFAGFGLN
ncbi:MAG TPA: IS1595 family transposase [Verrucomicrobiae bacterium]|nr:IS1595 family transposase [Verrucomicrobiae bacterium]